MEFTLKKIEGDKVLWIVAVILGLVSLLSVYSAVSAYATTKFDGDTERVLMKHLLTLVMGYGVMWMAYRINYRRYSNVFLVALWLCIPLLVYTLLWGANLNSASRSIRILGISFQSSDLAKIVLMGYVARMLCIKQNVITSFKDAVLPIIVPTIIVVALIVPENLSTAVMLFVAVLVLMFVAGVRFVHLLYIVGVVVMALLLYIAVMMMFPEGSRGRAQTWVNRTESFFSPKDEVQDPFDKDNYQTTFSKIAVATGGVIGKGPGKSTQRNFLPHPYSDFIYAIILEEYGLGGGLLVLFMYVVLMTRAVRVLRLRPCSFAAFLTFGLTFLIVMQALINMGVAVSILPVTGQPLPFVSMGGTSILFTGLALGILMSVSRDIEREKKEKQLAAQGLSPTNNEEYGNDACNN